MFRVEEREVVIMKKTWRKYLSLAVAAVLTATTLTGCGVKSTNVSEPSSSAPSTPVVESGELTKATEGSITVYTAFEDDQIDKYLTSFKEKYPDIKVEVIRESTGTLIAKVIAEKDNPVADVIWGTSASVMLQLEPYGLITGYKPEKAELLDPKFYDSASEAPLWTGCDVYETAFLVNTKVCEDAGVPIPTSFADLLNPCYKDMIVMPDPTSSGTGMLSVNGILQIMGEEKGWEYMKALNENIANYTTSGSKPAKMAAAGECGIGISFGYRCSTLLAEGNPVEVVFPSEGCGWDVEANCLLTKSGSILPHTPSLTGRSRMRQWLPMQQNTPLPAVVSSVRSLPATVKHLLRTSAILTLQRLLWRETPSSKSLLLSYQVRKGSNAFFSP